MRTRAASSQSFEELLSAFVEELQARWYSKTLVKHARAMLGRFFAERREHCQREDRRAALRSLLFVAVGLALSLGANYAVGRFESLPLFADFMLIPSWFFVWSGFESYVDSRGEFGRKKKYYGALSLARIAFRDLEGYEGGLSEAGAPKR